MSIVKDQVKNQLVDMMVVSKNLQEKISQSKTKIKKSYYMKKLKKNNIQFAKLIKAYDQMNSPKGEINE